MYDLHKPNTLPWSDEIWTSRLCKVFCTREIKKTITHIQFQSRERAFRLCDSHLEHCNIVVPRWICPWARCDFFCARHTRVRRFCGARKGNRGRKVLTRFSASVRMLGNVFVYQICWQINSIKRHHHRERNINAWRDQPQFYYMKLNDI